MTLLLLAAMGGVHAQDDGFDDDWGDDWGEEDTSTGLTWSGFVEGAGGSRWKTDPAVGRKTTLGDLRLRLETEWAPANIVFSFKGDVWYDGVTKDLNADFRELALAGSPVSSVDVKVGRQVLTWGTGDLVFLNDLFPKDWVSFFAGRDTEYLKAPSNTLRLTQFNSFMNVDFAWTPVFAPDEYLDGERFSFFSPMAGTIIAPDPPLSGDEPAAKFKNGEFALRLFRTIRGTEYALYGYQGFFKQPSDFSNPARPGFARLTSLGGSLRRSAWSGVLNFETSYYVSGDDRSGTNPAIPNSQLRFLTGFEREWITNFTVGLQYYLEWTQDHDALIANSPTPQFEPDEFRHVLTTRLTYRSLQDKLIWSLFAFWSPSDQDYFLLPSLTWRYSDAWSVTGGANLLGGDKPSTFFGQFRNNENAYLRVRYNF